MIRVGFSLIEIMIAMAICLLGLTVVFQMAWISQQHAKRSADLTDQQVLCQNRLNEMVAGVREWADVANRVCEEDSRFRYSIRTRFHPELPLRLVEVVISRAEKNSEQKTGGWFDTRTDDGENSTAGQFRMTRYLPAMPVRGPAMDQVSRPQVPSQAEVNQ